MRPPSLLLAVIGLVGCDPHVFSPPARAAPLETPATVGRDRDGHESTGVQLEGGSHAAILGFDVLVGSVRARHEVARDVEVSGEATWLRVKGDAAARTNPNVYAVRAGAKYRIAPWLAAMAGAGGGTSAGGNFVSPDVGLVVGYENPYVVPFFAVRGAMSAPFAARAVDVSSGGQGAATHVFVPRLTWLGGATAGIRVPLGDASPSSDALHGALLGGLGFTHVADDQDGETAMDLAGGVELVF